MKTETGYLTRIEAALYAGVTARTITRWIADGHLSKTPGRRGRRMVTLIKVAELDQIMTATPDGH